VAALFDGRCGVCARSARWLGDRDARGRLERLDLRDPDAAARFPALSPDAVRAQMHVVDAEGRVRVGIDGVRAVLAELPGWGPAAAALGLPGVRGLAGLAYLAFARNRLRFNRWFPLPGDEPPCTDACAVDWSALERAAAEPPPGSPR
jgi:predicted DCC family thiol-disulfide oxidoreductase YuxK